MINDKNLPIVCPCSRKSALTKNSGGYKCNDGDCPHSNPDKFFKIIEETPVIISEILCDTVCNSNKIETYTPRNFSNYSNVKKFIFGQSDVTKNNVKKFISKLKQKSNNPSVLIIGSGERGSGTSELWNDESISIHGIDVYKSSSVNIVCDAHYLPLESNFYDGVWIQAVLEHVVEPQIVVSEIYRVMKYGGIIYAETPFMQQVHEGAYDFNRFTVLGHRYLFKDFSLIDMGGNKGAETVLAWSIRYFVWAIFRSRKLSRISGIISSFLLRPFSYLVSKESMHDSSSGTYFMGLKVESNTLTHKDLVKLYRGNFNK